MEHIFLFKWWFVQPTFSPLRTEGCFFLLSERPWVFATPWKSSVGSRSRPWLRSQKSWREKNPPKQEFWAFSPPTFSGIPPWSLVWAFSSHFSCHFSRSWFYAQKTHVCIPNFWKNIWEPKTKIPLGGSFKLLLFSPLFERSFGEIIQIWRINIFQMGWFNHQLANCSHLHFVGIFFGKVKDNNSRPFGTETST